MVSGDDSKFRVSGSQSDPTDKKVEGVTMSSVLQAIGSGRYSMYNRLRVASAVNWHRKKRKEGGRRIGEPPIIQLPSCLQVGAEYSSDAVGDGPVVEVVRMREDEDYSSKARMKTAEAGFVLAEEIHVGSLVFVEWNTFPSKYWDKKVLLPEGLSANNFQIMGRYTDVHFSQHHISGGYVQFDSIDHGWAVGAEWIRDHGSGKVRTKHLVTRRNMISAQLVQEGSTEINFATLPAPLVINELKEFQVMDQHLLPEVMDQGCLSNLGVGTLNMNGLTTFHFPALAWLHSRLHLGVIVTTDTRVRGRDQARLLREWKKIVPGGDIQFSDSDSYLVGGVAFFLDSHWANRRIANRNDKSRLGILMELSFTSIRGPFRIAGVYWPTPSTNKLDTSMQLTDRLDGWLAKTNSKLSKNQWIQETLKGWGSHHSSLYLLLGDFNDRINSPRLSMIEEWGLKNAHLASSRINTHFSGTRPTGQIDFILANRPPVGWGNSEDMFWRPFTDHRPIWARFEVGDARTIQAVRARRKGGFRILKNPTQGMAQALSKLIKSSSTTDLPPDEALQLVSEAIVTQWRIPFNPPCQYWSPIMRVDMLWYAMHVAIRRAKGAHPAPIFQEYTDKAMAVGPDAMTEWEMRFNSLYPNKHPISSAALDEAIEIAHQSIAGRKRREKYESIRLAVTKRDKSAKLLFRSLGGNVKQSSMDRVEFGGKIYTDPRTIHNLITNHFQEWFSNANKVEPPRDLFSTVDNKAVFMEHFNSLNLPVEMTEVFYKAVTAKMGQSPEKIKQDLSPMEEGIQLEDFLEEVRLAPKGRSSGPSGLTYDMLQRTPKTILVFIHQQLQALWTNKATPVWLKRKWLCAIPKEAGSTDINKIRPVMLIEVLRKLWTGAMIRKIKMAWEKFDILEAVQYGFRANRSCPQAILQLVNAMEASFEGQDLFMSSWDIKRAFDSIPRPIIELALRRLGVPTEMAVYMAYIDEGDNIQVKSPISVNHGDGRSFSSQQGAGQGDKASPSVWIAVMDILLTGLRQAAPGDFVLEQSSGEQYIAPDLSYADDLITLSSTREAIQVKAEVVSAMAICLGLDIAVTKFRTCAMVPGKSPPPLQVYTKGWVRQEVPFQTDGTWVPSKIWMGPARLT
jgi:hypothetical protein